MGEMLRLIHENDIKPGDVEKVDLGANHAMLTSLLHHRPTTGLEAKFSMEYCLSILLLDRKAEPHRVSGRLLYNAPTCRR